MVGPTTKAIIEGSNPVFSNRQRKARPMNHQCMTPETDLQQLGRAVANLTEALAHSERRHRHLARTMRWGALIVLALVLFGGILVADRLGTAHAQNANGFPQAASAVEALNNINANLMVMGELGKTMQQFSPAIKEAIMSNPEVRTYVQEYFKEHNLNPSADEQDAYAMQALVQSVVGTFVDSVVLMQRIRQDSDAFRDYVTGPEEVLRGLEKQLQAMNLALASVPAMATQMDLMNRNIASMTYSMGSTMGRMGSWMPW
jgi:hypothetical protein